MQSSTIEIFARPVERTFGLVQHLYIISTDSQGHKKILRAGPETNKGSGMLTDDLKVIYTDYIEENRELLGEDLKRENRTKVYTITGTDEEVQGKMDKMWEIGQKINAGNYDYKLPTPGCPESICHVQNSNTAAKLFAKAVNIDLKPALEEKKLWAPGIDGHLDHTNMDKFVHRAIDTLKDMQNKIANDLSGLGNFIKQSKERLEQFSFNKSEHYLAGENIKFYQLMKDLNLGFVLNTGKSYKYIMYGSSPIGAKYYCNAAIECFNKQYDHCKKFNMKMFGKTCNWEVQKLDTYSIEYLWKGTTPLNLPVQGVSRFDIQDNNFYNRDYLTTIAKQCNNLSSFRDDKSLPFYEQIDSICSFEGLNDIHINQD